MPLSPQRRRRGPHAAAANPNLANADQNLTEVDTRLTKVDNTCQKLTPSTPAPTPNPSKTATATPTPPASTFTVNPTGAPRTNLNNPEQIRTNLNTAKRPDQIGSPPESPPITPKKRNLNTVAAHLRGERDELGQRAGVGQVVGVARSPRRARV